MTASIVVEQKDTSPATYPDDPFKVGVSGKYKLLIRNVTQKYNGFEYELEDISGKLYKAESVLRYPENNLLRCIVTLSVKGYHLVVEGTKICNKQDLTSPIHYKKKSQIPSKKKVHRVASKEVAKLDNPFLNMASGICKLRICEAEKKQGNMYYYLLEDAKGRKYEISSLKRYTKGSVVSCGVEVHVSGGQRYVDVTSIGPSESHNNNLSNRKHSGSSQPAQVGGRFRIIYTPMGNKR